MEIDNKKICEYDHVKILASEETGIVIAICETKERIVYTVEHDTAIDGYYQREFCLASELELIE